MARDISRRKRAEDELRESEERFRALVTATSDVVYRMSPDWAEMRHLDGREFIADTHEPSRTWMEKNIPAGRAAQVTAAIADAIRARQVFELEHRVIRADGTLGWTFSRAIPILDAAGEIAEWFGAASDVTGSKQAEEELARVTAESERRKRLYEAVLSATPDFVVRVQPRPPLPLRQRGARCGCGARPGTRRSARLPGARVRAVARRDARPGDRPGPGDEEADPGRGAVHRTYGRRIYDYIFVPVSGRTARSRRWPGPPAT